MLPKPIRMRVIKSSSMRPGLLSLRVLDENGNEMAPVDRDTGIRDALKRHGFRPGDVIEIVLHRRNVE